MILYQKKRNVIGVVAVAVAASAALLPSVTNAYAVPSISISTGRSNSMNIIGGVGVSLRVQYNIPSGCHFNIHSARPSCKRSYYQRKSQRLYVTTNNNNKDDYNAHHDDEKENISMFGVGEKTLELRDLVGSVSDDGIDNILSSVSQEALVQPALQTKEEPTTIIAAADIQSSTTSNVEKSVPTLQPMAVLKFLAPTLALWVAPPVMSLIDTAVVGRFCGPTDLAALSPGCTMIDASAYLFMFIATAATNLVASAHAKGDIQGSERIVSEALFMACISGIFLASIVFVAGQPLLLAIAGHESRQVVPSALKYATIRAFGQPAVVMASVARAAALARKDTKGPLVSVALAFLLNAVGTIALVRGTNLGIMGAAIGTLGADVAATLFLLVRIKQSRKRDAARLMMTTSKKQPPVVLPLIRVPSLANFRRFCHYAAPIFFTILGKSVVYNGVAVSVGRLGSVALAAHQVLLRSFFFWTPVGDSVGMTSQVFLPGILADEQQTGIPKRGAKRLLFLTGLVAGFGAAALAGLLPSRGAGLFTTDHAVAMALKQTAPILGISVFMHAIALTCEGMLLAQRDLRFLSISYVITTIATIALLLSPLRPATLGGSWWILALFQGVRALQFAIRNVWISSSRRIEKKA
eukprot:scaffold3335_cov43-Attheya_sp.AAC.3